LSRIIIFINEIQLLLPNCNQNENQLYQLGPVFSGDGFNAGRRGPKAEYSADIGG
jgi:hypothetical protein